MQPAYRVTPLFLIRIAGVPFDALDSLATSKAIEVGRELIRAQKECDKVKQAAEGFFRSREQLLSPDVYRELRVAVHQDRPPARFAEEQPAVFSDYASASGEVNRLRSELQATLENEVQTARGALITASREFLPLYLSFAAENIANLVLQELGRYPSPLDRLPSRNNAARKAEQTLLLYLQRIAAKNDTFSQFGPSGWGRGQPQIDGARLDPVPGIAKREPFLERWTAHALAAAVNSDPEVFPELLPRLNPNGVLLGESFILADTGEAIPTSSAELATLKRCDGKTPIHALDGATVEELLGKKILIAALEVPALNPFAFQALLEDVSKWRDGNARARWLPPLGSLAQLPGKFSAAEDAVERNRILAKARKQLAAFGAERKPGQRSLYSAINPIGEECFRETNFVIDQQLIDEVATEAEPWIDFWRDNYAFIAARVAAGLQMILQKAPRRDGALPLPAFLRACEMAKLPLTGPGLVGLAMMAFQEVKAAFRERMKPHAHLPEYKLTAADCRIVRDNFHYQKFDEFTYPSADLQLAAKSTDAVAGGDYRWILSELHPPAALLHHAAYWNCPDEKILHDALSSVGGKLFHFGFFAADFTAHTAVRVFDAMPELATFVAPQRAAANWKRVPPAEAEVYVDEKTSDVRLRNARTREDLGSFARNWVIPLGFHPFQFGMSPQMPRLRCGKVIVQRRAWSVTKEELSGGDFSGVSRDLVVAVEKLRATKDWPRYVFIRPTEQALRRSGAEGRDKDTKPVFIDLESYLFLEIFHRWLTKAGELEVTEMLPAPDELCWMEKDGRRTFELRTLIVPRA